MEDILGHVEIGLMLRSMSDEPEPELTEEEERANRATHHFDWQEGRCWGCDCRMFGRWARLPCEHPF